MIEKNGLNMRTLFSIIIETLDFVESKLRENINSLELDALKIKKSIFLNVFIIWIRKKKLVFEWRLKQVFLEYYFRMDRSSLL